LEDEKKNRGRTPRGATPERGAGRRAAREPTSEVSRGKRGSKGAWLRHFTGRLAGAGPLAWVVLALGLLAAALMVATEFSTIQSVRIGESTCGAAEERLRDVCETGGGEQHNWSLLVLGVLTVLLAFGAAVGRSKPAAVALGLVGVVVLFVALVLDRPTLDDKRGLEVFFGEQGTEPQTGGGYTLEILAGVLALLACGAALLRERVRPQDQVGSPRARPRARGGASDDEPAPDPAA